MDEVALLKRWFRYDREARLAYLDLLETLPQDELEKDRGASYPTLLDIAAHMQDALRWWIRGVIPGTPEQHRRLQERTFEAIRQDEAGLWSDIEALLDGLDEAALEREVREPRRGGSFRAVTVRDGLWHLVEEELQHRGELNALLWQMDVDPPILQFMDVA